MKLSIEIKEDNKVTTYTADLTQAQIIASGVIGKLETFLKDTFKKETFTKDKK